MISPLIVSIYLVNNMDYLGDFWTKAWDSICHFEILLYIIEVVPIMSIHFPAFIPDKQTMKSIGDLKNTRLYWKAVYLKLLVKQLERTYATKGFLH